MLLGGDLDCVWLEWNSAPPGLLQHVQFVVARAGLVSGQRRVVSSLEQGELLFAQTSWTPHHYEDLIYLNAFLGDRPVHLGRPRTAGRRAARSIGPALFRAWNRPRREHRSTCRRTTPPAAVSATNTSSTKPEQQLVWEIGGQNGHRRHQSRRHRHRLSLSTSGWTSLDCPVGRDRRQTRSDTRRHQRPCRSSGEVLEHRQCGCPSSTLFVTTHARAHLASA